MSKKIYDIFISYRRDGGGATAGRINDMLAADGYSVSYDVDTLREGRFDKQLLNRIEQCQDFILVIDKNCFVRTIDPATDKQEDWLWQELSYALELKKNIIPVLLAGADFPKYLPEDIDIVRKINGPKCVHEYFDEFYRRLRDEFLRAYPRLAKPSYVGPTSPMKNMACLKLKADIDCIFYLDGEECTHLKAGVIKKIPLAKGEYELTFVSEENGNERFELEFEMSDVDKLQKVNLSDIRDARRIKESETKRIAEEKQQAEEERIASFDKEVGELVSVKGSNGKYGFKDKNGREAIPCQWCVVGQFREGLAEVKDSNGRWGFIDKKGSIVIPCQWNYANGFFDGLAEVEDSNRKWWKIDKTGKVLMKYGGYFTG